MSLRVWPIVLALLVGPQTALADEPGLWRVEGTISGRSFRLECRLAQPGGVCIDATNRQRSHPLTSLAVAGTTAQWGFTTKVMIARIAMRFSGRIEGNRMTGDVTAAGRKGSFTAVRGS